MGLLTDQFALPHANLEPVTVVDHASAIRLAHGDWGSQWHIFLIERPSVLGADTGERFAETAISTLASLGVFQAVGIVSAPVPRQQISMTADALSELRPVLDVAGPSLRSCPRLMSAILKPDDTTSHTWRSSRSGFAAQLRYEHEAAANARMCYASASLQQVASTEDQPLLGAPQAVETLLTSVGRASPLAACTCRAQVRSMND
jgi:hypothetical protein